MKKLSGIFSVLAMLVLLLAGMPTQSAYAAENTGQSSSPLMTPNAWNALDSGLNGLALAIAINGTDIYVGGGFTDAGGDSNADYIAKWDGASWFALGTGLNGTVRSIVIHGSDIYVGGDFTDAGGDTNADYVAKWDGDSWSALGTGLNASVYVVAVSGSNVYVGGNFTDASGNDLADYIAKLDGDTWGAVGPTPLNSTVYSIALNGGEVYAGGIFTDAGGDVNADKIAFWNGSSWSALGSGLSGNVYTVVLSGGDVYAGGDFTNTGGNADADYIAKWNGTSWSDVGGGLNGPLRAITINGTDIYAGGYFTDAGGDANADHIAKWDGTSWSALGTTPLNGAVNRIVINGLDLYAGGQFIDAGGDANADRIARFEIDANAPTVNSFSATSPSNSLDIPITVFTASDNVAVTGYKITESSTPPAAGDAGWSASAPTTYTVASNGSYTLYPWAKDATGNVSAIYGSPASVTVDATAPTVTSFSAPTSSNSLTIPITSFAASDNVAVTGYKITESSTPPTAGDAGWTASAPTTYTVAGDGSYTLYPWAKDATGNVSEIYGSPASVDVDSSAPSVDSFTAPSSSTSLDISITAFTASDNVAVTGYKITESSTPPAAGDAGWSASAPTTYTVADDGNYTLYPWAKDAAGNVSAVYGSPASVSVDATAPTVTSFIAPSSSNSLDIPITTFSASDGTNVTGYLITESSTPPLAGDAGWTASAPTTYTVASNGSYTLYPWAKDAVGHVSSVYGSPASGDVAVSLVVTNTNDSGAGSLRGILASAAPGETVTFDAALSGGTITLVSPLTLDKDLTIDGSSLASHVNISGGDSVRVFEVSNGVTVEMDHLNIINGFYAYGAGINNLGTVTVTNSNFSGHNTDFDGDGAAVYNWNILTVTDSTFTNNTVSVGGGAIKNTDTATITNSTFTDNSASIGGAINNWNDATLTVTDSTFSNNDADEDGGGIYNFTNGVLIVTNSTFTGNTANNNGGVVINFGTLTVSNSTFYANTIGGYGGGIHNVAGKTATLTNNTFSGHGADYGDSIYNAGTLHLSNNIIANGAYADNNCINDGGTIATDVNNLIEDNGTGGNECGIPVSIADPQLGSLQDNGGFTHTMALGAGSPAIDAGDDGVCPETDQRGVSRPQGSHCDIGAYEYETSTSAIIDVTIGGNLMDSYGLLPGQEKREFYDASGGPVVVESTNGFDLIAAIRLQSMKSGTLLDYNETMGIPEGSLSTKYIFPVYENLWAPLNSQLRFAHLGAGTKTIKVTIGTETWTYDVAEGQDKRIFLDRSGGPVIVESEDGVTKIVAAIRLQAMANNVLHAYSETFGIPIEDLSTKYYFPVYENKWAPLNSQLRFAHLGAGTKTIKVTIGTETWTYDVAEGQDKRIFLDRSGGPVIIESLDGVTKVIAAIRLQSMQSGTLLDYNETMGIPEGSLSTKYIFPVYENKWAPLNSQLRFAHLGAGTKTIKVTIGTETWTYDVAEGQDKRIFLDRSGGPVIVESMDGVTNIVAAIRLQCMKDGLLNCYSETMGIPFEFLSDTYYFPVYENLWAPLNSQVRFGVP